MRKLCDIIGSVQRDTGEYTQEEPEREREGERQREKESEDGTAASGRLVGCLATDQQPSEQLTVHDKQQRQQQHTHIRTTRRTAEQLESDSYFFFGYFCFVFLFLANAGSGSGARSCFRSRFFLLLFLCWFCFGFLLVKWFWV